MFEAFSNNPRGKQALDVSASFTAIAFVVVALRLYTRFFIVRCPGAEDYGIIVAMIASIGFAICIGFQAKWGMGMHVADINPDDTIKSLKAFYISLMCYGTALIFQKISILLQYQRVFTTRKFQLVCWWVMGLVIVYGLWTVFGNIFACLPVRAFWTREPGAKCINQFAMWFTNGGMNILQDLIIILLPIPVIRGLNLGKRQKGALIGIFCVGGFVCIVSILRLPQLVAISNSKDQTYDNAPAATWSCVEANIGIICACLPLLRPLFTRFLPGAFSSQKRSEHTAPRPWSTIGASRNRRDLESHDAYALHSKNDVRDSDEDGRDIQVITDIRVQVEDSDGQREGWRSDSRKDWAVASSKGTERASSSTDTLVKVSTHT